MPDLVEYVCAYAERGYELFPLAPGENTPIVKSWPDWATNQIDVIEWAWLHRFKGCNVAIKTGEKLVVIDVDVKKENGVATMEALAAKGYELPPCPVVQTPSGGFHYWFAGDQNLRNCQGITKGGRGIGVGVDVRGDGGYITVPPSRTEKGAYRWIVKPRDVPPPPVPAWAVRMINPPPPPRQPVRFQSDGSDAGKSLERLARYVSTTGEGQRNGTLFWATCEAVRSGCDPKEVEASMIAAAEANGMVSDDGLHSAMQTIRSAFSKTGLTGSR